LEQEGEGEQAKSKDAATERCGKYPVSFKEGVGHLTKPEEYANVEEGSFGDPCNFKYPMDEEHLMAAWAYVSKPENKTAGKYSDEEWTWIQNRIKEKMKSAGHEVEEGERGELFIKVDPEKETDVKLVREALASLGIRTEQEPETDEHGCKVGEEKWDGEKCVALTEEERAAQRKAQAMTPNEGETREQFMSRCMGAENTMEECAANWKEPGEGEGEARGETAANFDKDGEDDKQLSPKDASVVAGILKRTRR